MGSLLFPLASLPWVQCHFNWLQCHKFIAILLASLPFLGYIALPIGIPPQICCSHACLWPKVIGYQSPFAFWHPICLLAPPFAFRHPHSIGSQKGPHPERWHLCFGEHISSLSNDTPYCSHVPGCDLILANILFGHLRRMDPHPSLTATWRMVLEILTSSQNFGLRKPKFWQERSHLLRLATSKAHSFLVNHL